MTVGHADLPGTDGGGVNLARAKAEYSRVRWRWQALVESEVPPTAAQRDEARRDLAAARKAAQRTIDEFTTRRFLSVNARRGLTEKLEALHRWTADELGPLLEEDPR
jgi:hypothetical protein